MPEYPTEDTNASGKTSGSSPDDHTDDNAPSFFSCENLCIVQVPVSTGSLNGFSIGFVAVYMHLYEIFSGCSALESSGACSGNSKCTWIPNNSTCVWKDCNGAAGATTCKDGSGYNSLESGLFACSMIVGSMIGSIFAGKFLSKFGLKMSFIVSGVLGIVGSALYHVATRGSTLWVMCVGRFLMGLVLGLVCVASPMYVNENAHPKYRKTIGVLFQVFTTFGIMFAALLGLAIVKTPGHDKASGLLWRMQVFCSVSTALSALLLVLGLVVRKSKTSFAGGVDSAGEGVLDPNEYSVRQMLGPLAVGAVTAGTLQLTGINAVMNYAPEIMRNIGMDPMEGNSAVMSWNFVTALVAIPLVSRFTMRQLFLACSFMASCACLIMCGIPVYPGVASVDNRNIVATVGIAVFIAAFEFGVGSCFFVLAQDLFPRSFRPTGSSFVVMAQFIFNIMINLLYPITVEAISGGKGKSPEKGQSVSFIIFGIIGIICFVLQLRYLTPWEDGQGTSTSPTARCNAPTSPNNGEGEPATADMSPVEMSTPKHSGAA
ncbi:putative major facilitator superfamily sugar transporter [Trypanosoma vivax]|nr:putative major facilitator superfamily sugar transporter [Trypanosoma vivax]KAH8620552.1 putative major facilitator superfamily sugar transporter [Trypanosoma vivax]KAH8620568.1 putative major facilitator superfamily sugar transporter [Trypanosoma vivax]KAH8620636.1 putative major facilitator superfamily sugar transporter [Trypanosoma vivax]